GRCPGGSGSSATRSASDPPPRGWHAVRDLPTGRWAGALRNPRRSISSEEVRPPSDPFRLRSSPLRTGGRLALGWLAGPSPAGGDGPGEVGGERPSGGVEVLPGVRGEGCEPTPDVRDAI